ncbi:alpha/beta hydrolase [Solidesulfovibrio sp.]|uniref:esterase/lipase family protein n=1 Tax=Solidesulfovibrio sp. TaxID=2910990 RepID=UPI002B1EBD30|nr:alpha/beta hydrolase [Solidesulfovibrio sp.]MEA5088182.1 alpha/beta hydrolase [Solidesulfovibrio sp.]
MLPHLDFVFLFRGVAILAASGLLVAVAATTVSQVWALCAALRHAPPRFLESACRGRRLRCRFLALVTSLGGYCAMGLTLPLGPLVGRAPRRTPRCAEPVVVCLHGLYHNPAAFLCFRPALTRRGFGLVLCPGYSSLGTDFEAVAQALAARLRVWLPPDAPLCFLGHSLGGLLARRLMAEADLGRRTLACVTLGAPHGGSSLAALAFGRLGRGLVPGGPVCRIVAALPDPPEVALLSLASPVDAMVTPLAGLAVGRPGWREEATPAVSHLGMLWHPAVIARTAGFLAVAAGKRPA